MVDGMIVREMFRRCMYNPKTIKNVLKNLNTKKTTLNQDGKMVSKLWASFTETGFLSVRILDHITEETMGLINDPIAIHTLIMSLPAKPFDVVSVHD